VAQTLQLSLSEDVPTGEANINRPKANQENGAEVREAARTPQLATEGAPPDGEQNHAGNGATAKDHHAESKAPCLNDEGATGPGGPDYEVLVLKPLVPGSIGAADGPEQCT